MKESLLCLGGPLHNHWQDIDEGRNHLDYILPVEPICTPQIGKPRFNEAVTTRKYRRLVVAYPFWWRRRSFLVWDEYTQIDALEYIQR